MRGSLAIVTIVEAAAILAGGMSLMLGPPSSATAVMAIGFFAIAMGVQNTTSPYLLRPYRRTTHLTSTITDFGGEIGIRLRAAFGSTPAEPAASHEADFLSSSAAVVVCFCLGAGVGGIGMATIGPMTAWLLAAFLILATLLVLSLGRAFPTGASGPGY